MATDYEVILGNDGKVIVVLHPACKITRDDILALLGEMGIDSAKVSFVEPDGLAGCGELDGSPVIIPIDNGTCELPELEGVGRQCGTAGGRVIVLFGPDCSYDGLHPIADKYGTQCDWSADRLKGCISGGVDAPRGADGTPADRPTPHEVKCRK
jgi:hypothetical protein